MARRRKIDTSGWRREVEAEKIETALSYYRRQEGKRLYESTLALAAVMRADGRSKDDALLALRHKVNPPPKKADGSMVAWGREQLAIEEEAVATTEAAIKAAFVEAQSAK